MVSRGTLLSEVLFHGSWRLHCLARHRQAGKKHRVSRLRFKLELSVVPISDDAIADDQAKSGPLPDALCCEKRFKEVLSNVFGNTRSVVMNFHEQLVILAARPDADLSPTVHGVDRVID